MEPTSRRSQFLLHPWTPWIRPSDPLDPTPGYDLDTTWIRPWIRRGVASSTTVCRGGTDISIPVSQFPSDSQTLSSVPQTHTILSDFKTCKKGVGNWDPGRHPWSRHLADPSFNMYFSFFLESGFEIPAPLCPWNRYQGGHAYLIFTAAPTAHTCSGTIQLKTGALTATPCTSSMVSTSKLTGAARSPPLKQCVPRDQWLTSMRNGFLKMVT